MEEYLFQKSELLISEDGANLVKRTKDIAFIATGKYWVNNHAHIMNSIDISILMYIKFYINNISIKDYVTGSAQPKLTQRNLALIKVPLPPLPEQQRIVSKIEELFAELDKIDKAQETYDSAAKQLREKVLDCAMRGKLVPQDPNDEPASELLKRIEEEKQQLIEQKVVPKVANSSIENNELPFSIPNSWKFVRLGMIANTTKFQSIKPNDIPLGTWIVGMGDIEKETGKILKQEYISEYSDIKSNKYKFSKSDILYGKLNPYLKKIFVAPQEGVCTTEFIPIHLYGYCSPEYYSMILKYKHISLLIDEASYGATLPRVKPNFIGNLIVPLPPMNEQFNIVQKAKQIFTLFNLI